MAHLINYKEILLKCYYSFNKSAVLNDRVRFIVVDLFDLYSLFVLCSHIYLSRPLRIFSGVLPNRRP